MLYPLSYGGLYLPWLEPIPRFATFAYDCLSNSLGDGSELAIAGVAQSRHDVALIVQVGVQ